MKATDKNSFIGINSYGSTVDKDFTKELEAKDQEITINRVTSKEMELTNNKRGIEITVRLSCARSSFHTGLSNHRGPKLSKKQRAEARDRAKRAMTVVAADAPPVAATSKSKIDPPGGKAAVSAAVISSPRCKKKQRTMISSTSVAGGDDNEEGPLTQLWNQEYYMKSLVSCWKLTSRWKSRRL